MIPVVFSNCGRNCSKGAEKPPEMSTFTCAKEVSGKVSTEAMTSEQRKAIFDAIIRLYAPYFWSPLNTVPKMTVSAQMILDQARLV
jgi:hypothetical protein